MYNMQPSCLVSPGHHKQQSTIGATCSQPLGPANDQSKCLPVLVPFQFHDLSLLNVLLFSELTNSSITFLKNFNFWKQHYFIPSCESGRLEHTKNRMLKQPLTSEIVVSHATSPENVFIQFCSSSQGLLRMMEDIQISVQNCVQFKIAVSTIRKGLACLAMWPVDQRWYRALVLEVNKFDVLIQFVDYGESMCVSNANLHVIEPRFFQEPFFAFKVKLAAVVLRNECCEEKFKNFLKENAGPFIMSVVEEDVADGTKSVKFINPENGEDLSTRLFQRGIVNKNK